MLGASIHEISVCQSIINTVLKLKSEQNLSCISKINLMIGKLSCINEEALLFAFDEISKNTELKKTALSVNFENIQGTCCTCKKSTAFSQLPIVCPECDSLDIAIEKGDRIFIETIEVEDED